MSINLSEKYASHLEKVFTHDSYIRKHCKGKVDFDGAQSVLVYMLNTTPLVDYQRSGSSRYGELKDVEDTVFKYTMSQDKAFNGVVDRGDALDQSIMNKAGEWLRQEIREQVAPYADRYALTRMRDYGHIEGVSAKPDKTNIVTEIFKARVWFNNHYADDKGRVLYVPASFIPAIMLSDEWLGLEHLAGRQIPSGVVGRCAGFDIVEMPDRLFDENHYFTAACESAVAFPFKIESTRIHNDPVGINGAVIEGRQYFDVFVLGSQADAVYSLVASSCQLPAPTITDSNKSAVTLTASGASKIYYTLDGTDPRFSKSRNIYTAAFDATGLTVKAVAMETEGKCTSAVASKDVAAA